MVTTHNITFSRDNLIQLVLRPDFYEKNPALEPLKPEIDDCVKKFRESGKKAGCGCRADVKLIYDCMEHMLTTVEGWKETDPGLVCDFVLYATKLTLTPGERVNLGIFFRRSSDPSDVSRYEFTCQQ
jgi:hypothetical protein